MHVSATKPTASAARQVAEVETALTQHKVIGLLFYNPAAADDQADKTELAAAATKPGVVKVAVPVTDVAKFTMLTNTVPVSGSPTLILIDRQRRGEHDRRLRRPLRDRAAPERAGGREVALRAPSPLPRT